MSSNHNRNSILYQFHDEMELDEILNLDSGHSTLGENEPSLVGVHEQQPQQQMSGDMFATDSDGQSMESDETEMIPPIFSASLPIGGVRPPPLFNTQSTADSSLGVSDMVLQLFASSGESQDSNIFDESPNVLPGANIDYDMADGNEEEGAIYVNNSHGDVRNDESQSRAYVIETDNDRNEGFENSSQVGSQIKRWKSIIPNSILKLFCLIRSNQSDWAFVHTISAQMCQDFMPMDCFISLKQGLLLSLASFQTNSAAPPLSIVAIGKDTLMAGRIMRRMAELADRCVVVTDSLTSKSTSEKDNVLEASPILMASHGVLLANAWNLLRPAQCNQLQRVVDSGRYVTDKPMAINLPLRCAIWTHMEFHTPKEISTLSLFFNIFGVPILVEENASESLVDFMLEEAVLGQVMVPNDELYITMPDMQTYLNVVRRIPVTMSSSASDALRGYFIAARLERLDILSQRSFVVLHQMAESHARLCLRSEVLRLDVVAAISLAEQCLTTVFGRSVVIPFEKAKPLQQIDQVDEYMAAFDQWISRYTTDILSKRG